LQVTVFVGEHNTEISGDEEDAIGVEQFFVHPNYSSPDTGNSFLSLYGNLCAVMDSKTNAIILISS
jgi:hypothetical protein